jgi:hypothetical protein
MNGMQPPRPHHELSFEGMAPWPVPGELTLAAIEQDPAARCCQECGRRLLLLLLRSSSWVSHRSEHVSFRDDRSVVRKVSRLSAWRPSVWWSALGLTPTRVRFPVPAAENAASFHFEIDAPRGVQIAEASLLAGRPSGTCPSFDHVQGGFPTVGLHVIEVPNGSLSRAQIGLQVVTRGWVTASTLTSWAVFGLLLAVALHHAYLKQAGDLPVLILVALAGGAASIVAQSDGRGLAAHLLKWTRALATAAALLPLVATTSIAFAAADPSRVPAALSSAAAAAGVIAVLLTAVCLVAWRRQRRTVCSPWEQSRARRDLPDSPADFDAAARAYGYDRPAVRVDSAEGWHTEFYWDDTSERLLVAAMERQPGTGPRQPGQPRPPRQPVQSDGRPGCCAISTIEAISRTPPTPISE